VHGGRHSVLFSPLDTSRFSQLPKFAPTFVLLGLGWIGILVVLQPEFEPIDSALLRHQPPRRFLQYVLTRRASGHSWSAPIRGATQYERMGNHFRMSRPSRLSCLATIRLCE
jgi:hypothetical protein